MKTTKKLVAKIATVILAGMMVLALASCGGKEKPIVAGTEPNPESDFEFVLNDNMSEVMITKYKGTREDLVIPATIQGVPVTEIGARAAKGSFSIIPDTGLGYTIIAMSGDYDKKKGRKPAITSLVIPESVKRINDNAFDECWYLQVVVIKGCEVIGKEAFNEMGKNTPTKKVGKNYQKIHSTVEFPENLTYIGSSAFSGAHISEVNLEKCHDLWYIGNKAFDAPTVNGEYKLKYADDTSYLGADWDVAPITKVVLPEGLANIGTDAFLYQVHLTEIEFPSTLRVIGDDAFTGTGLVDVTIPEGVLALKEGAFRRCKQLKTISLPSSLKYIIQDLVSGKNYSIATDCDSLENINLADGFNPCGIIWNDVGTTYGRRNEEHIGTESFENMFSGAKIKETISLQKFLKEHSMEKYYRSKNSPEWAEYQAATYERFPSVY